ncbi:hypothetical protein D8I30_06275 [Brevundimonas naejangsanensis]|uniref:Uncharacterized protein n=1 Tax=Brevundimonas naejangsanensis TaxID=588932 RepID=A0A494RF56_9CAUL|nr:hypothetical protein [Brevundimonas naejangsanensis]AYG94831.1 hypothetical protein D8I30_06275 [Brevundimonas naejangsanensis]
MAGPVHYEIYIRRTPPADWTLSQALEDRKRAVETAEDLLRDRHAVAVRVTKETLNPETMEFASVVILNRGAPEVKRKRPPTNEPRGPGCRGVQDLYAPHARETIGRILEDWLNRQGATAFELLHRPDLAERLEASGVELQHAVQKVAVPEAQGDGGQSVHELMRHYQRLAEQAIERLLQAGRRKLFPSLADRSVADLAHGLSGTSERAFIMGGIVAGALRGVTGARARLERLMDICDRAPADGPPRALVFVPVEQILCELLGTRVGLAQILGPGLDQGSSLAAVVRMVAPREIGAVVAHDARIALLVPPVEGPPARLGERLAAGEFPLLAAALARIVLRELMSQRRLRPGDAVGEIDILRALATALTATAGRLLTLEEVQNAFIERSRSLVAADFVAAYVAGCPTVLAEAERLTRLCENVTGGANKRAAARWLDACVASLRFETELRAKGPGALPPGQRLLALAGLQRAVRNAGLPERETQAVVDALGVVGGAVEADARLTAQLARAAAPAPQKLAALLRLAATETGPSGPVAERARAEALRLLRAPETRAALSVEPQAVQTLRPLMQAVGLAA